VEVFRRSGANLLELINSILDLSKIEAGHLELENVRFDLEEVVGQAIELAVVKAHSKGIRLESRLAPDVRTDLIGDPTRLRQILTNLLSNAVKFTESGGVVLTVRNHETGSADEIEFIVSDTGIGIPPHLLETIFADFTQADTSTTRRFGGTGLGLGISRRLVEMMNGRLTVTSSPGEGSKFSFTAHFGRLRRPPVEFEDLSRRRLLVIDHDPAHRVFLQETLQEWGLEGDVFASPEEAEAHLAASIASENPYSLTLIDREVPGISDVQISARFRRLAPGLPVAILPGSGFCSGDTKSSRRAELLRVVRGAVTPWKEVVHPASSEEPSGAKSVRSCKVLIAEDAEANRLLLEAYFKGSPH